MSTCNIWLEGVKRLSLSTVSRPKILKNHRFLDVFSKPMDLLARSYTLQNRLKDGFCQWNMRDFETMLWLNFGCHHCCPKKVMGRYQKMHCILKTKDLTCKAFPFPKFHQTKDITFQTRMYFNLDKKALPISARKTWNTF